MTAATIQREIVQFYHTLLGEDTGKVTEKPGWPAIPLTCEGAPLLGHTEISEGQDNG